MINIILYKNTAERNSIRPALTQVGGTIQGVLRESTSLLNIEITFEKRPENIFNVNYMWVQELNRFYHITNVTALRHDVTVVSCVLDPLYTYYTQLIECPGVISRCESVSANKYLQDNKFSYPVYPAMIRQLFSESPTDTTLVLMVTAGADQVPTP